MTSSEENFFEATHRTPEMITKLGKSFTYFVSDGSVSEGVNLAKVVETVVAEQLAAFKITLMEDIRELLVLHKNFLLGTLLASPQRI